MNIYSDIFIQRHRAELKRLRRRATWDYFWLVITCILLAASLIGVMIILP